MNAVVKMSDAVDVVTCQKAGSLAAYGLGDKAIADALLLSNEQIAYIKSTDEFKIAYANAAQERTQRAIDLEEGWDGVEQRALATVLETLEHNRDPRFALHAAFTANRAVRRSPSSNGRVIDASRAGNVIVLNLNQKFVNNVKQDDETAMIDVTEGKQRVLSRKLHDVPSPQKVSSLLGITDKRNQSEADEILELCRAHGITVDHIEK